MGNLLLPIVLLCVVVAGTGAFRLARRRLAWDRPMVALLLLLVALGLGAIAAGREGFEWSLATLLTGFVLAQVPATFSRMASLARIQGRWARARRLAFVALCFQPTARSRVLHRTARAVALARAGRMDPDAARASIEALGPVAERIPDATVDVFLWEGLYAIHTDTASVLALYEPLGALRFGVPWRAGAAYHVVEALCSVGRTAEAAAVVEAMHANARAGEGAPAECDAYLNRARIALLSWLGETAAVRAGLGFGSTLRTLFRKDEAAVLLQRAERPAEVPVEAEPTVRAAARAVRAEGQLPSDLGHLRTPAPATVAVLALLAAAFLAESLSGSSLDPLHLFWLGGAYGDVVVAGEWWRLVASMFLHAGTLHLVLNGYFLLVFGNIAERLLGSGRFLVVYLAAGLSGSLTHIGFGADVIMVGASGAIFGVFGAAFAAVRAARDRLPVRWYRRHTAIFAATIGLNVYLSASLQFVSLSAHAGGFVAGFAIAALMVRGPHGPPRLAGAVAVLAWAACLGYAAWGVATSVSQPATATVPLEDARFEVATGDFLATVALPYPVTWHRDGESRAGRVRQSPFLLGVSDGEYLQASVLCGDDPPECPDGERDVRCFRSGLGRLVVRFHFSPGEISHGDALARRIGDGASLIGCRPIR